mmetsp:Transcript_325/g.486  ORF Transcript_325/g.486 Transcript_325/m.486 type:complete len:200 (+) Transcript_325:186-785(+)
MYSLRHLPSHGNGSNCADVLNTAICTGSNENFGDGFTLNLLSTFKSNVLQGAFNSSLTSLIMLRLINLWYRPSHRYGILWTSSPGDSRSNIIPVDNDRLIIFGTLIRHQALPILHGLIPLLAAGTHGTSLEVFECNIVGCNNSSTRTSLNGHIGNGHPGLHGEGFDGASGKFDCVACTAGGSDEAADVEDDIFGRDALR